MRRYKLLIFSKPVPGREQEYNDWYQNLHLSDVVAISGIRSAQRFRFNQAIVASTEPLPYLAIYDVETDDINGTIQQLQSRAQSRQILISDALSMDQALGVVYEEYGAMVRADAACTKD